MRNIYSNIGIIILCALMVVGQIVPAAFASTTDGTIDGTNRYAWSENAGWIDFGSTEGNVHITDSGLTGYAWSELTGWISLHCSNTSSCGTVDFGVENDSEGTLSGYAWSENTGWIDFDPTNGGVTIDSSGDFAGYAWGENIGWIVFNCSTTSTCGTVNYSVSTDWLPSSARGGSSSTSSSSSSVSSESRAPTGGGSGGASGAKRIESLVRSAATLKDPTKLAPPSPPPTRQPFQQLQERTCTRVRKHYSANTQVLKRVNERLMRRFKFTCSK